MIGFVAGFGRCGTSLTMAMLAAGGLPVSGRGTVFEDPHFQPRRTDERWLRQQTGRIVKWVCPLSTYCPDDATGRVLWLDRDPEQQARSHVKLAIACGEVSSDPAAQVTATTAWIRAQTPQALAFAAEQGPVLRLRFEDILVHPVESSLRLAQFFRPFGQLDTHRAAAIVRRKSSTCAEGLEVDIAAFRHDLAANA